MNKILTVHYEWEWCCGGKEIRVEGPRLYPYSKNTFQFMTAVRGILVNYVIKSPKYTLVFYRVVLRGAYAMSIKKRCSLLGVDSREPRCVVLTSLSNWGSGVDRNYFVS